MSKYLFQYAVLRYVHDTITEEFLNIGIVVYSKQQRYLSYHISNRYGRLSKAFNGIERFNYNRMVSPIGRRLEHLSSRLKKPELFEDYPEQIELLLARVLPPDDSSLVFGGFGGGLTNDLDEELARLNERFVERYIPTDERESRSDDDVWDYYSEKLAERKVLDHLKDVTIQTPTYKYHFDHAFKNERWHPLEPVSLDLVHGGSITRKANTWIGNIAVLSRSKELGTVHLLLGAPRKQSRMEEYEAAVTNLHQETSSHPDARVNIVREEQAAEFVLEFSTLIEQHSE